MLKSQKARSTTSFQIPHSPPPTYSKEDFTNFLSVQIWQPCIYRRSGLFFKTIEELVNSIYQPTYLGDRSLFWIALEKGSHPCQFAWDRSFPAHWTFRLNLGWMVTLFLYVHCAEMMENALLHLHSWDTWHPETGPFPAPGTRVWAGSAERGTLSQQFQVPWGLPSCFSSSHDQAFIRSVECKFPINYIYY